MDLTVSQAAEKLNCAEQKIRNLIYQGEFPGSYDIGTPRKPTYRIPEREIEEFKIKRGQYARPSI